MTAAAGLKRLLTVLVAALTMVLIAATASAAPASADFLLFVTAGQPSGNTPPPVILNGGTTDVTGLSFKAGPVIDHNGGDEASARVRFQLTDGLRWGNDEPDPTESCTGTATTAECQSAILDAAIPARRTEGWLWDVVADRPGSYVLRAEIIQTSAPDSDLSSNTASVTVVVREPTGPSIPAAVSASAVKVSPAKPKAGSPVAATVRVTAGGAPLRPAGITCSGSVAGGKLKGTARARSGTATCLYRPPKTARGKILRGTISFKARGTRFTRRFSVGLR